MYDSNMQTRVIQLKNLREREEVEKFLKEQGISLEADVEYTIALYENDSIIGTGSISGKVIKSVAVDKNYKGRGITNKIVSLLINEQYQRGNTHLFIYTKPENLEIFQDIGFYEIETVNESVSLFENQIDGIKRYTDSLSKEKIEGEVVSSIVMNCNPFTLGHQYLIEKASKESAVVHIFLVWEDKSYFSKNTRLKLLEEGTKHLSNVIIHKGKDYIISNTTFPSYFMKDNENVNKVHALLDLKIFGKFIAPALNINRRYIGEEPYCKVTREYNETMKEILPKYNIEVVEVPRLKNKDISISASRVRKLLEDRDTESLKQILPSTTYDYLIKNKNRRCDDGNY